MSYGYRVYVPIILGHSVWGVLGKGYLSSDVTYEYTELYSVSF